MKLLTPKHLHSLARIGATINDERIGTATAEGMAKDDLEIIVHSGFSSVREDWLNLQRAGWTTLYQSLEWCETWNCACAREMQVEPCILSAHDRSGRPVFIMPFGIYHVYGSRVLRWLSHSACTYGLGVFDVAFLDRNSGSIAPYWPDIIAALPAVDAIRLDKMPRMIDGRKHPLASLFTAEDANCAYRIGLQRDFEALYGEKRSAKARSQARNKDRKLAAMGNLKFGLPQTPDETHDVITQMFEQQIGRLAERGVHNVFDAASVQFVHDLADLPQTHDAPKLRAYTLWLDDRVLAVKLGMAFKGTYWALISSLNADGIERLSPGDLALRETVEACCNAGLTCLDMADGDPGYKSSWASDEIQLASLSAAFSLRGRLTASVITSASMAKKWIKDRTHVWSVTQKARKVLLGRTRR